MASPDELKAMDLRVKGVNDQCIGYGQWDTIDALHTLAKANNYQTDKPVDDGEWWRHVRPTPTSSGSTVPKCNLPVVVARLSASSQRTVNTTPKGTSAKTASWSEI